MLPFVLKPREATGRAGWRTLQDGGADRRGRTLLEEKKGFRAGDAQPKKRSEPIENMCEECECEKETKESVRKNKGLGAGDAQSRKTSEYVRKRCEECECEKDLEEDLRW